MILEGTIEHNASVWCFGVKLRAILKDGTWGYNWKQY